MGDNPEECPVCMTAFDDTVQRPRTLPCGHTFCTSCMDKLNDKDTVTCPTCRVVHAVPEEGQFPVSYIVEAFIKRMRDSSTWAPSAPLLDCAEEGSGNAEGYKQMGVGRLCRKMHSMLQEQEAKVLVAIGACQEVQSQLDQYQTTLSCWADQQQRIEKRLQEVLAQSRGARVLVLQEESQVAAKKEEVQHREQQLHAMRENLHKVTTDQEADVAIMEVGRCTDEAEKRLEECREMFPNVDTVVTAMEVKDASIAALEAVQNVLAAMHIAGDSLDPTVKPDLSEDPNFSIRERLQAMLTPTLKVEDLLNLKQTARSLLKTGRVFAVHEFKGRSRYARISFDDGRLYLHSLLSQPPPPGVSMMQMDEVLPPSPPCKVFLDLAWPGSAPRRVLINLFHDTPMGRQFLLLCTGQQGPSYANSRLWRVWDKGEPGECVYGGDFEWNDGTGGAALLPRLGEGEYRKSRRAGNVFGVWLCDPARGAQFAISTRDRKVGSVFLHVFGEVVSGLDVVALAAHHRDITEVTVVDCGVGMWG